jgi:hypothetical protein
MATAVSEEGRAQSACRTADSPDIKPMSAQRDEPRVLFGSLGWADAEGEGTARKGRLMELSAHIRRAKGQVYEEYLKLNPWERELQQ